MATKTKTPKPVAPAMAQAMELAQALNEQRTHLGTMVGALQVGIEALKADALPEIRGAITTASQAYAQLEAHVKAHPELFESPKTVVASGIKFGFKKGAGGLVIADAEKTVTAIAKLLPEQFEVLVQTTHTPVKAALNQLPAEQLKRLGVTVVNTVDQVVVAPVDSDVDKLVKALVAEEVGAAAAATAQAG